MTTSVRGDASQPVQGPTRRSRRNWRHGYSLRLVVTDLVVLVWAVLGAAFVVVHPSEAVVAPAWVSAFVPNYLVASVLLIVCWWLALAAVGSRDYRRLGTGTAEYKAVLQSGVAMLVGIALASLIFRVDVSRGWVLSAMPAALVGLMLSRLLWRRWLRLHRQRGEYCSRVLLVGSTTTVAIIAEELRRHPDAGYNAVGVLTTDGHGGEEWVGDLPVVCGVEHLPESVETVAADTVFVTDGHGLQPSQLRELSWSLEPGRQHLVMAPSLTDIAGPRIHARPVAGLPLVHVETPRYEGVDRFLKRSFDIVASASILALLAVPLTVVALMVVTTSPGGLFFSHERIGKRGKPFRMLKFRSMVPDADSRLEELLRAQGTVDKPLFKIENDPRITHIGRFIRRYSIDEIPQLLNVLKGDMSLVGPRPQVAKEVALYDHAAARRLFVSPGMTGLWQVSGRSNLSWDESVRLDLYYVENWSLTADIAILFRTVRAVLAKDGAV